MQPLFQDQATKTVAPTGFIDITQKPANMVPASQAQTTALTIVADAEIDQLGSRVGGHASKTAQQILSSVKASDVDGFGTKLNELIAVLMTSLDMWMKQCTTLLDKARTNLEESLVKMLSLSAVCDTVGEPPDQGLAQAMYNRRVMLQQGATQAELVVRQLESIKQQLIDQRMRADQILNVTIPAWKSAAANK